MIQENQSQEEIRRRGLEALLKELGPSGLVRFMQQYETGEGDLSAEREAWNRDGNVESLAERIRKARPQKTE